MRYQSILLPLAIFWAFTTASFAQNSIVQESEKLMALGSRPSFHLEFKNADAGMVEKLWKEFVKNQFDGKTKKDKKTGEWVVLGLESSLISKDKFDLYAKIEENGKENSTLDVWFDVGSYFLNRRDNPGHTQDAVDVLKQFHYTVRREVINKDIKQQEEKLKDLEKKMKNLKKDNESLHKDIENYRDKIKKAEEDISKNEQEQEKSQMEIEAQKRNVEEVKKALENVERENN